MSAPAFLAKAHRALATARVDAAAGDAEAAVNRAYYAAFYAATAALLAENERPKTHAGLHARFFAAFVATGRVAQPVAETLRFAFNARQKADYEAFTVFDEAAALDLVRDAAAFVEAVERVLERAADVSRS